MTLTLLHSIPITALDFEAIISIPIRYCDDPACSLWFPVLGTLLVLYCTKQSTSKFKHTCRYRSSQKRPPPLQIYLIPKTKESSFRSKGSGVMPVHVSYQQTPAQMYPVEPTVFFSTLAKNKCIKALNLLHVVAHTSWGADQLTILHLYRSLIRSKLDYGSIVYGSARQSHLKMLDPIQNQALHLCLGAFRSSPAASLCVEDNEPPLHIRRTKLSIQYAVKVASNPARDVILNFKSKAQFEKNPTRIAPLGMRISGDLQHFGFNKQNLLLNR